MAPAFGADWYDSNWLKARKITIDQTDIDTADLTNYPLYVNMTLVDVGTDSQADCDDFVFTDSTNVTKLDHEIETCSDANNWAEFWVEVPTVDFDADTVIYMYYDNAAATNQQNTQGTWNSNYKAVWHLNGTFNDSTVNVVHCANSGTSAVTDEYIGDSRSWDAIDDNIDCGSPAAIDNIFATGGGTIQAWIRPLSDGEAANGRIVQKYGSTTPGYFWFLSGESGTTENLSFTQEGGANDGAWTSTNKDIDEAVWNHVVITYDNTGATNDPLFYVDGVSVALNDDSITAAVSDANADMCIGNNMGVDTACATAVTFDGRIDEVRYVDTILPAQWVKADWECQRGAVDGNSCITVGNEGEEPAAGDTVTVSDEIAIEDRGAKYNAEVGVSDEIAIEDQGATAAADNTVTVDDEIAIEDEGATAASNEVTVSDEIAIEDEGATGSTPVQNFNTIVLRVVKDPFGFMVFTNATIMACTPALEGGVVYNSDTGNLNICDGTNWILPDGSPT